MVEEKKKKNKGTIVAIIILVLLVLGFGGYFVYDMFLKTEEPVKVEEPKEEVLEEPDFYDVSELVKNNYIEKIDANENDYIKISDGKVLAYSGVKNEIEDIVGIEGTPKYVSAMQLCSDCQGFGYIVLTEEGDVYYAETEPGDRNFLKFNKANTEKSINIYNTLYLQQNRFYSETDNGKLLRVDKDSMNVSNTFENDNFYVDFVYRPNTGAAIAMKLDKDGKIYTIDNQDIKYNNNSLIVENVYVKVDESVESETPVITYYLISKDKNIYTTDSKNVNANMYSEKEVINYEIEENSVKEIRELKITYVDNTTDTISNVDVTSTMHRRSNK